MTFRMESLARMLSQLKNARPEFMALFLTWSDPIRQLEIGKFRSCNRARVDAVNTGPCRSRMPVWFACRSWIPACRGGTQKSQRDRQ